MKKNTDILSQKKNEGGRGAVWRCGRPTGWRFFVAGCCVRGWGAFLFGSGLARPPKAPPRPPSPLPARAASWVCVCRALLLA